MSDAQARYRDKLITKQELVGMFQPGQFVQLGVWYGEPWGTMAAINEYWKSPGPLNIGAAIATSPSQYLNLPGIQAFTGFVGPRERESQIKNNNVFYTPSQYTDASRSIRTNNPHDFLIHRVAPMDERGMFNFSLTASWEYGAIEYIRKHIPQTKVVFEVNPHLPRIPGLPALGNNELSIDYCDYIVEDDTPLMEYPTAPPNEAEQGIARNVAELIEDGATVQLGFGTIPMAIGKLLASRKDLGIHTEMFCEGHVDLIEAGVVTNARKGLHDGLSVATFALGTKRLHNFLRDNKDIAMLPVEKVNGPAELAKINKMACVNSVLMVDMNGQACAHCLGKKTYSGLGGAFEFASGALLSPGGKSISCLPSTTTLKDGRKVSNIVAQFEQGARITIPEHTIDWVVTEFGAARLKFMPLERRAEALIGIAHPDFREDLARSMSAAGMRLEKLSGMPAVPAGYYSRA